MYRMCDKLEFAAKVTIIFSVDFIETFVSTNVFDPKKAELKSDKNAG